MRTKFTNFTDTTASSNVAVRPILFRVFHDGGTNANGRHFGRTPQFDDRYLLARDV